MGRRFLGLDAGSVSVKLVVLDEGGGLISAYYKRHGGQPLSIALELLEKVGHESSISITGSSGRLIAQIFNMEPVNEVIAHGYATIRLYPHVRSIIEMGGEDSKLILLGDKGIADFSMNSVCAAGTGSFLDQQAERLRITLDEFGGLALKSIKPPRIAGRCSVFAKSDMIHLQQIATPLEDIVSGLCFAVARNFKGAICRGRKIIEPVGFQGGVAANKGMLRAFKEVFGLDNIIVPENYALMGAIGAVLKDMEENRVNGFEPGRLKKFIHEARYKTDAIHPPLRDDDFFERHLKNSSELGVRSYELKEKKNLKLELNSPLITHHLNPPFTKGGHWGIRAYLGIDIGSISTNLAVIDGDGRLLSKRYLMTAGRPIEAVARGLDEIGREIGNRVVIAGVGTTGSGRYMIADYVGADIVKNEITAQATAAAEIDRSVDTIFEIGGQDSKYISLKDGVVVDFEMNKACAAGTGSFLEEQGEKLNIDIKGQFADMAFSSECPCPLGERCTVFMENSLMAQKQRGASREDLVAGLAYSIVENYIHRVVGDKPVGQRIFFQGGVAFNKAVVAAFEKYLNKKIIVPPHHDVTGAIGMALIVMRHMKQEGGQTAFKGFDLSKRPYTVTSFECKACPNMCEINRVKVEGDSPLFYGGRCEKYDVKRGTRHSGLTDLFEEREGLLKRSYYGYKESAKGPFRARIGIPYIFFFHDLLPFWSTILYELGFEVELSPNDNVQIIRSGLEAVLSEACFPVKVAHGHVKYLIEKGVDAILMPSFINLSADTDSSGFACPYTQTISYVTRAAIGRYRSITPIIDRQRGMDFMLKELLRVLRPYGIKMREIKMAYDIAESNQLCFQSAKTQRGREIISQLKGKTIVIVGRSYNAFDYGMNIQIPKKLMDLNMLSIPMDFLDIEAIDIAKEWPNMYWRTGQRILAAAEIIRENPLLYPLYIGNFSCGPDSFILRYFKDRLGGKPFLHIEIDEHSADAGIITRCEAFLDSLKNVKPQPHKPKAVRPLSIKRGSTDKIVYIPRMSDHAYALSAAFEHCGLSSEVIDESDSKTLELGRRYVSGKECYPCTVTTGDMVKKALSPDFDPKRAVFFMPSGTGPCRFGQYNVFHRLVLDELGLQDVPIFSPVQDKNFYKELDIVGKDFVKKAWTGIVAIGLLEKALHETRPYEKNKGQTDNLYNEHLKRLFETLKGRNGRLEPLLYEIRREFDAIPKDKGQRPLIGVIGEIFVRSNRFSNEDLIRRIEELGGEVYLSPVEEWIYYINLMAVQKTLIKKNRSDMINLFITRFFQRFIEHRLSNAFKGFIRNLKEPSTTEILRKASPYIHRSFEGEAILSIGKAVDMAEAGLAGVVNAMPFGCMPGTIVTALLKGIKDDYGIPYINIPYDGTEASTTQIQLEAFMHQARIYSSRDTSWK